MSLSSILNIATSGLQTSQSGIRTVSGNISNVNTPGYVRVEQTQTTRVNDGKGAGVEIGAMRRAADRFLSATAWAATGSAAASAVRSEYLDMIQSAFGDPTGSGSLFARLDRALGSFETGALNPGSLAARREAVAELQGLFGQMRTAAEEVGRARSLADARVGEVTAQINSLLQQVVSANVEVQRGMVAGDATGAEQRRDELVGQLSELLDVKVTPRGDGTVEVRTTNGQLLAGLTAATLEFQPAAAGATTFGRITIALGTGTTPREFEPDIQGGLLRGLLNVRDRDLGALAASLGELAGRTADALNAVHNQSATLPPLASAIGADTGLMAGDALNFTGTTTIAVVDSAGVMQRRIDVDFTAGTIAVNGAPFGGTGATVGGFAAALNAALGGAGTASFANGVMRLDATVAGTGFVFDQPETGGSLRGEKGFAQFFGLNDLVRTGPPASYATGLSATDAHGFPAGAEIGLRLVRPDGAVMLDRQITLPGGTVVDLLNALNDVNTGLGMLGGFGLDPQGRLRFTPDPGNENLRLEMTQDAGPRAGTSRTLGALFGLNPSAQEGRALAIDVNPAIVSDPRRLGFARPDLTGLVVGDVSVGLADSQGAQALFDVSRMRMDFGGFGAIPGRAMTLADYAATVAGEVGARAATAEADKTAAEALKTEATTRRANKEGVNLDEELVKLTSYQQAYAAAARMIRAADEMYDILLRSV
jgi:flagellar hook-associated protein 1